MRGLEGYHLWEPFSIDVWMTQLKTLPLVSYDRSSFPLPWPSRAPFHLRQAQLITTSTVPALGGQFWQGIFAPRDSPKKSVGGG